MATSGADILEGVRRGRPRRRGGRRGRHLRLRRRAGPAPASARSSPSASAGELGGRRSAPAGARPAGRAFRRPQGRRRDPASSIPRPDGRKRFLDVPDEELGTGGEGGLLGLAFHPGYAENGLFFVHYTDTDGDIRVARYRTLPGNPNRADPASAVDPAAVDQPFANHNGGQLAFGRTAILYIALGDGGAGGDPRGQRARTSDTLLGKILRIDVDRRRPACRPTPSRPTTRSSATPGARPRSGPTACATPGASASTARPATCGSATSARASARRSTSSRRTAAAARTTAGTAPKERLATRLPARSRRSSSTAASWGEHHRRPRLSRRGGVAAGRLCLRRLHQRRGLDADGRGTAPPPA